MKLRKILIGSFVLLLALVLVACKPGTDDNDDPNKPVINGANNVTIEVGTTFDPKAGVTATLDGVDITTDIVITGTVDVNKEGTYTLTYKVTKDGESAEARRVVTVIASRLYANGEYNFKFAQSDLRHTFFGAAEQYLLENVYGGVPLFINSGMSIYSSRVQLPVANYVPVMGWGVSFGTLTEDDSAVKFSDGTAGEAGEYTYRGAFSSNPTTFNQWLSDDSVSSDALAYMMDSLYAFEFNATNDGYEVNPSMADADPVPVEPYMEGDTEVALTWNIPIKEGLEWFFHPTTDATGLDTEIDAHTFVATYRHALEQGWFRARAGGSHFWALTSPVKGAQAFYDAEAKTPGSGSWESVGLKASEDGKTLTFEFTAPLSEWNVKYWLSSNTMTPVHLGLLEKLANPNQYGTSPATMAFTGPFYLDRYEPDKVLAYKANPEFHSPNKYNYTGYNFAIIERSEIIFAEFEAGNLDGAGVPLTKYGQYVNNPGIRRSPGATTFRMNINGLGSVAEQRALFPDSVWTPTPILANRDFRRALYFGVDRETLAWDVLKTSDPGMYLFSNAYLVDPQSGTAFRDTAQGSAIGETLSADTYGYNPDAAQAAFLSAVAAEIAAGRLQRGTSSNPTVIELEVAVQAASTSQQQLGDFVKNLYESLFVDTTNHVKVALTVVPVAFPDIYYTKQLVGEFDLGMGGISGSTLDAAGFLEVFSSDNRGGFTLNWGFDTSVAEIPVTYTLDDELIENEYWSFDAIVTALSGTVEVVNGVEAAPDYTDDIAAAVEAINAIPATVTNTAAHIKLVDDAQAAVNAVPASLRDEISNFAKLAPAVETVTGFKRANAAAALVAEINELPATANLTVAANLETVQDLLEDLAAIHSSVADQVTNKATLVAAFDKLVELYIDALVPTATSASQAAVRNARALADELVALDKTAEPDYDAIEAAELAQAQAMVAAIPALADLELEDTATVNAARAAVQEFFNLQDELTIANAGRLLPILEEIADLMAVVDAADVKVTEKLIDALPAVDNIVLVDRFQIAAARAAVTALQDRVEGAEVANEGALKAAEAAVKPLIAADDAINFYWLVQGLPAVNDASAVNIVQVQAARTAYKALTADAKALVDNATALEDLLDLDAGETFVDPVDFLEELEEVLDLA